MLVSLTANYKIQKYKSVELNFARPSLLILSGTEVYFLTDNEYITSVVS